jgi:GTP cyclohydrolase III
MSDELRQLSVELAEALLMEGVLRHEFYVGNDMLFNGVPRMEQGKVVRVTAEIVDAKDTDSPYITVAGVAEYV